MRNFMIIVKNIIKRVFAKFTGVLIHILLPVVVSLIMILMYAGAQSYKYKVAVIDNSKSISSESVLNTIVLTDKFVIEYIDEFQISDYITEGKATVALEFDDDFEDRILNNDNPSVKIYATSMSEGSEWVKSTIDYQILNLLDISLASGREYAKYKTLTKDLNDSEIKFSTESISDESIELRASRQMFGMYLMLSMISACTIAFLAIKDKRRGVFSRIIITPVRASTYTIANISVNLFVQLSQVVLIILLASKVFGMSFHAPLYQIIFILFIYSMFCVSIGQLIVAIAKNETTASALMSLILTPTCMIGGCFWNIEYMPKLIYNLSYITPQRWTLDAIKNAQAGESFALCTTVIFSFSVLLYLISVYILKKKDKKFS